MTSRWRSVLFTPGMRPDRIIKALQSGSADIVVADLEDAVAPGDKAEARQNVRLALEEAGQSRSLRAVRINTWPGSLAESDLEDVMPARPDLIVVPKAESVQALQALDARLGDAELALGFEEGSTRLLLILESARGILHAESLALASERVAAVAFGAEDLAADAGMRRTRENSEMMVPRSLVALAAASAGVRAIDMITADFRDLEQTADEARSARDLGYAGKMVLHPAQVVAVHEALRPTADELSWAKLVIEAVEAGGVGDGGVVEVAGKMVDVPLIRQARRILQDSAH